MGASLISGRLPDELLRRLDGLITDGMFGTRADAVQQSLEMTIRHIEAELISAQIVAGYQPDPVGSDDEWGDLDRCWALGQLG